MPTPEERREVIRFTGLCSNENCTAHDGIIDRILMLVDRSVEKAVEKTLKTIETLEALGVKPGGSTPQSC